MLLQFLPTCKILTFFFLNGEGSRRTPKLLLFQSCRIHNCRKAPPRNKLTIWPYKSAERTLEPRTKRDPVPEHRLQIRRGRRREPPQPRQQQRSADEAEGAVPYTFESGRDSGRSRRKTPEKNSQKLPDRRKQPPLPEQTRRRQGVREAGERRMQPPSSRGPTPQQADETGCAETLSLATMAGRERAATNHRTSTLLLLATTAGREERREAEHCPPGRRKAKAASAY
jgi:hypothetical protein